MLLQLLKNTSLYTLSSLFSKGIGLLLLPIFTRLLAPADYGALDLLTAFSGLVNVVVALEIAQGLARYLPSAADERERRNYVTTCLAFSAAAYLAFAIIASAVAPALSELILGSREWAPLVRWAVPTIALGGIFYLFQVQLSYELRAREYTFSGMAYATLTALLSLLLLLFSDLGVKAIFAGQLAALIIVLLPLLYLRRRSISGSVEMTKLRRMLAFSIPLVISSVAFVLYLYIDRAIISRLLSLHDVGLFGIGQRVASLLPLLIAGLQAALTPLIYHHHGEPGTPRELARLFRLFWGALLALALALGLLAPEIVTLFAAPEFTEGAVVVFPLALAAIFSNLYVFAPGLNLAKKTWTIALINCVGAVVNVALSLLLTPLLGILGASLATAAAGAALLGIQFVFSQRHYPIPYAWGRLAAALGVCVGVFLLGAGLGFGKYSGFGISALKLLVLAAGILGIAGLLTTWNEIRAAAGRLRGEPVSGNS